MKNGSIIRYNRPFIFLYSIIIKSKMNLLSINSILLY